MNAKVANVLQVICMLIEEQSYTQKTKRTDFNACSSYVGEAQISRPPSLA